ncbi:MAG: HD domain-containing protein [Nannocystales bacterium]
MDSTRPPDDIVLPDSPLCVASRAYAERVSPPFLFNHVMRTYAFAATVGGRGPTYDAEVLYIGCILHDLGLCETVPTNERFEVDGADAAQEFLTRQGMPERQVELVWDAIALHTTAVIPQRKQPEIALVQLGAALDVGVVPLEMLSPGALEQILDRWPRLGFKQALMELLKQRLLDDPRAATSHVIADVGCRHVAGFETPNFCDTVAHSKFAE